MKLIYWGLKELAPNLLISDMQVLSLISKRIANRTEEKNQDLIYNIKQIGFVNEAFNK